MRSVLPILVLLFNAAPAIADGPVGRYQLAVGDYPFMDYMTGQQATLRATFKIDTVTGEVWVAQGVRSQTNAGGSTQEIYWLPTKEWVQEQPASAQDWYDLVNQWAHQPYPGGSPR